MRTKFFYIALSLLIATTFATVEYEDGVAELNKDNFNDVINNNKYVMVKFTAPWCGHCKSIKPKWASAAELYQGDEAETEVVFANVDATANNELATEYGVSGYPTIKFFVNGVAIDFNGGREEE